jgi:very-short-patch-repair endonuclease
MVAMEVAKWAAITQLTSAQHGLVTVPQAGAVGVDYREIEWAVERGLLKPSRHGVLVAAGAPTTEIQPLAAACLTVPQPSAASHFSAAWIHGLGVSPSSVELTAFGHRPKLAGVRVHLSDRWAPADLVVVGPIVVTSVARTLLEVAAHIEPPFFRRLVADALMRKRCRRTELLECHGRIGGKHLRGNRVITEVLMSLDEDDERVQSHLELRYLRAFRDHGLPPPVLQYQVVLEGRVFVLDFAWPEEMVAAEVNGFGPHAASRIPWDQDQNRDNILRTHGWDVYKGTSQLSPDDVAGRIRRALHERRTSAG